MECDIMGESHLSPDEIWDPNEAPTWHFPLRSSLMEFQSAAHQIILDTLADHPFDTITSLVKFYDEYKQQNLPLEEYYRLEYVASITEDSYSCIGLALQLRRNMLTQLSTRFPFLKSHLYLGTGAVYSYEEVLPERFADQPPNHTGQFKEHVMLVLKFSLETDRAGFFIFDLGYCIDMPVVVMEDGLSPHTGPFSVRGRFGFKVHDFRYYDDRYVHWIAKDTGGGGRKPIQRWFFVGKPLINPRELEKRNRVPLYHAYMWADIGGPSAGFFGIFGDEKYNVILLTMENLEKLKVDQMPSNYFDEGIRNEEIEKAFEAIAKRANKGVEYVKTLLQNCIRIGQDEKFVEQLKAIDQKMEKALEEDLPYSI